MKQINEYVINDDNDLTKLIIFCTDLDGHSTILIKSCDKTQTIFRTNNILLKTSVSLNNGERIVGDFHILTCISNELSINSQFDRVTKYTFAKIHNEISSEELLSLFQSFKLIFETKEDRDTYKLQLGVYGELIFIKYLCDNGMEEIAQHWHSNFFSKHDLEIDETTRVEIKSTNKEKRIHRFKHNQLVQNNLKIYVVSVMLEEVEIGYSLYELFMDTMSWVSDYKKKLELERLLRACNVSDASQGIVCDKQHAFERIKIFEAEKIPHLCEDLPDGVSSISYDSDLENVDSCLITKLIDSARIK